MKLIFYKKSSMTFVQIIVRLPLVDMNITTVQCNISKWRRMASTEPEVVINQFTTERGKTIPRAGRRSFGFR